jgi:hypothetical protein
MNSLESEFLRSIQNKDLLKVQELLRMGFPVNLHIRKEGQSFGSHTYPLILAIEKEMFSIIQSMISSGALVNCFDSTGMTPLMAACSVGSLETVKLLLSQKADISSRDFFGNTLLHIAGIHAQVNTLRFCIESLKIPVIVKNRKGQTPLAACISAQEESKSLETAANLQESIEYLWKVEEEFKSQRLKQKNLTNSYVKKHPRFNLSDLASVPLLADEKKLKLPGNLEKSNIQSYLKAKHREIYYNEVLKEKFQFPGVRSASVKPFTN